MPVISGTMKLYSVTNGTTRLKINSNLITTALQQGCKAFAGEHIFISVFSGIKHYAMRYFHGTISGILGDVAVRENTCEIKDPR